MLLNVNCPQALVESALEVLRIGTEWEPHGNLCHLARNASVGPHDRAQNEWMIIYFIAYFPLKL